MDIDIVFVSWARDKNLEKLTTEALDSLLLSENKDIDFKIIVIESNHTIDYDEYPNCKTIHPKENFGYNKYLNIGRKIGTADYVVLCNNDITFEKNWAYNILEIMQEHPKILSASPSCPQIHGINTNPFYVKRGYEIRKEVMGWCIFQQRKIYDIIGDLDENFLFWYADNDYALTLQSKSIVHCLVGSSVVNHHDKTIGKTAESLGEDRIGIITDSQYRIFYEKWKNLIKN